MLFFFSAVMLLVSSKARTTPTSSGHKGDRAELEMLTWLSQEEQSKLVSIGHSEETRLFAKNQGRGDQGRPLVQGGVDVDMLTALQIAMDDVLDTDKTSSGKRIKSPSPPETTATKTGDHAETNEELNLLSPLLPHIKYGAPNDSRSESNDSPPPTSGSDSQESTTTGDVSSDEVIFVDLGAPRDYRSKSNATSSDSSELTSTTETEMEASDAITEDLIDMRRVQNRESNDTSSETEMEASDVITEDLMKMRRVKNRDSRSASESNDTSSELYGELMSTTETEFETTEDQIEPVAHRDFELEVVRHNQRWSNSPKTGGSSILFGLASIAILVCASVVYRMCHNAPVKGEHTPLISEDFACKL